MDPLRDGHVNFSDSDDIPMPPDFNAPDNSTFVPQPWGHDITDDQE